VAESAQALVVIREYSLPFPHHGQLALRWADQYATTTLVSTNEVVLHMEHETRFELAFPSPPKAAHTRCSLIARSSLFRWQRVAIVEFIDVYEVYRP
jgi:hypothetical protein